VDPEAKKYNSQSPYAFENNNPVRLVDVNGLGPDDTKKKGQIANEYTYEGNGKHQFKNTEVVCATKKPIGRHGRYKKYIRTIKKEVQEVNYTLNNANGETEIENMEYKSYTETTTETYYMQDDPQDGQVEVITNSYTKVSNEKVSSINSLQSLAGHIKLTGSARVANVMYSAIENNIYENKYNHTIGINMFNNHVSLESRFRNLGIVGDVLSVAYSLGRKRASPLIIVAVAPEIGNALGNQIRKLNLRTHDIFWKNYD